MSLNFGPEWMRSSSALSGGGNADDPSPAGAGTGANPATGGGPTTGGGGGGNSGSGGGAGMRTGGKRTPSISLSFGSGAGGGSESGTGTGIGTGGGGSAPSFSSIVASSNNNHNNHHSSSLSTPPLSGPNINPLRSPSAFPSLSESIGGGGGGSGGAWGTGGGGGGNPIPSQSYSSKTSNKPPPLSSTSSQFASAVATNGPRSSGLSNVPASAGGARKPSTSTSTSNTTTTISSSSSTMNHRTPSLTTPTTSTTTLTGPPPSSSTNHNNHHSTTNTNTIMKEPFYYTREFMLSLYDPIRCQMGGFPVDLEWHEIATVDDDEVVVGTGKDENGRGAGKKRLPLGLVEYSEKEKMLFSGSLFPERHIERSSSAQHRPSTLLNGASASNTPSGGHPASLLPDGSSAFSPSNSSFGSGFRSGGATAGGGGGGGGQTLRERTSLGGLAGFGSRAGAGGGERIVSGTGGGERGIGLGTVGGGTAAGSGSGVRRGTRQSTGDATMAGGVGGTGGVGVAGGGAIGMGIQGGVLGDVGGGAGGFGAARRKKLGEGTEGEGKDPPTLGRFPRRTASSTGSGAGGLFNLATQGAPIASPAEEKDLGTLISPTIGPGSAGSLWPEAPAASGTKRERQRSVDAAAGGAGGGVGSGPAWTGGSWRRGISVGETKPPPISSEKVDEEAEAEAGTEKGQAGNKDDDVPDNWDEEEEGEVEVELRKQENVEVEDSGPTIAVEESTPAPEEAPPEALQSAPPTEEPDHSRHSPSQKTPPNLPSALSSQHGEIGPVLGSGLGTTSSPFASRRFEEANEPLPPPLPKEDYDDPLFGRGFSSRSTGSPRGPQRKGSLALEEQHTSRFGRRFTLRPEDDDPLLSGSPRNAMSGFGKLAQPPPVSSAGPETHDPLFGFGTPNKKGSTPSLYTDPSHLAAAQDAFSSPLRGTLGGMGVGSDFGMRQAQQQRFSGPEPDLSQHATSVLGSLALDDDDEERLLAGRGFQQPQQTSGRVVSQPVRQNSSQGIPSPSPTVDPNSIKWWYRDPKGNIQGPFSAAQMQDWYSRNYFPEDLMVRRETEMDFQAIAHLTQAVNDLNKPFFQPPPPPPRPAPAEYPSSGSIPMGPRRGSTVDYGSDILSMLKRQQSNPTAADWQAQLGGGTSASPASFGQQLPQQQQPFVRQHDLFGISQAQQPQQAQDLAAYISATRSHSLSGPSPSQPARALDPWGGMGAATGLPQPQRGTHPAGFGGNTGWHPDLADPAIASMGGMEGGMHPGFGAGGDLEQHLRNAPRTSVPPPQGFNQSQAELLAALMHGNVPNPQQAQNQLTEAQQQYLARQANLPPRHQSVPAQEFFSRSPHGRATALSSLAPGSPFYDRFAGTGLPETLGGPQESPQIASQQHQQQHQPIMNDPWATMQGSSSMPDPRMGTHEEPLRMSSKMEHKSIPQPIAPPTQESPQTRNQQPAPSAQAPQQFPREPVFQREQQPASASNPPLPTATTHAAPPQHPTPISNQVASDRDFSAPSNEESNEGDWQSVVSKANQRAQAQAQAQVHGQVPTEPQSAQVPEPPPQQISGKVSVVSQAQFNQQRSQPQQQPAASTEISDVSPTLTPPSKPAPWVKEDEKVAPGPSLREIQEKESKRSEARKAAERQAQAAALAAEQAAAQRVAAAAKEDSLPSSTTWASSIAAEVAKPTPPGALWTKGSQPVTAAAPKKKTLKQIQEEEEARRKKTGEPQVQAPTSQAGAYAKSVGPAQTAAQKAATGGPWQVVGGPKTAVAVPVQPSKSQPQPNGPNGPNGVQQPTPARVVPGIGPKTQAKPPGAKPPPTPAVVPPPAPAPAKSHPSNRATTPVLDPNSPPPPSPEFLKWCKEALKGMTINIDEFIQMILTFPLEPMPSVLEMISDTVYENSSTLDGKRFANDFTTKRKADALARIPRGGGSGTTPTNGSSSTPTKSASSSASGSWSGSATTMADAVRAQPVKQQSQSEWNFKVVQGKPKKGRR